MGYKTHLWKLGWTNIVFVDLRYKIINFIFLLSRISYTTIFFFSFKCRFMCWNGHTMTLSPSARPNRIQTNSWHWVLPHAAHTRHDAKLGHVVVANFFSCNDDRCKTGERQVTYSRLWLYTEVTLSNSRPLTSKTRHFTTLFVFFSQLNAFN